MMGEYHTLGTIIDANFGCETSLAGYYDDRLWKIIKELDIYNDTDLLAYFINAGAIIFPIFTTEDKDSVPIFDIVVVKGEEDKFFANFEIEVEKYNKEKREREKNILREWGVIPFGR